MAHARAMANSVHSFNRSIISLLFCVTSVAATYGLYEANDLHSFVSRPDLMPPKWNVTKYDSSGLSPGYWFVAPSSDLPENHREDGTWAPCQQGPAIYDQDGELVWSGACLVQNRKTYNFDLTEYQSQPVLQGMVKHADWLEADSEYGVYINANYEIGHNFLITPFGDETHKSLAELNPKPVTGGRSIVSATRPIKMSAAGLPGITNVTDIWIQGDGFAEVDRRSGKTTEIMWWAEQHVSLNESTFTPSLDGKPVDYTLFTNESTRWDPYHITSIDKSSDGDYLVSLAHTDTIYLVSRTNGTIKWRFGGLRNDFIMEDGFNFSRQHDARFISHTADKTVISFLDNTRGLPTLDLKLPSSNYSRGFLVELSHPTSSSPSAGGSAAAAAATSEFRAKVLQEFNRPHGGATIYRGNMQTLPNGNVLMGWGDAGYLTEHSSSGEVLMEARFLSETRFNTYRTFKRDGWVGRPTEPPVIKAFAYAPRPAAGGGDSPLPKIGGEEIAPSVMVVYASWNGGTEHRKWRFHDGETLEHLGDAERDGFETCFVVGNKLARSVYAIAASENGTILSSSKTVASEWRDWTWDVPQGILDAAAMAGGLGEEGSGDEGSDGEKTADSSVQVDLGDVTAHQAVVGGMNSGHASEESDEVESSWHFLLDAIGACPWLFTLLILPAPLGWVVLFSVLFRKPKTLAETRELLLSPRALWRNWRNGGESDIDGGEGGIAGSKGRGRYETIPLTAT